MQATEDGFRIHTVINSSSSPTEYIHAVTLPAGSKLAVESDLAKEADNKGDAPAPGLDPGTPSGAYVVDSTNSLIGGFASPWATDANGTAVPTRFEIRGADLVQVVEHRRAGVAYPVVADPYLGFDMISSAVWSVSSGYGRTLRVTPTGWSRANAGSYLAGTYGWNELYAKYKNRGLNTNLGGMRDQYICHQQIVAVVAPSRATWNLDVWRADVSYAATVNARCNPGGTTIFD